MKPTTEDDVKDMLINPYSVVNFADYLFNEQGPKLRTEDWIQENEKAMAELGPRNWLEKLLEVFSTPVPSDTLNPALAVVISDNLKGKHELIVNPDTWLEANIKLVEEIGSSEWLARLLHILQTSGLPR